MNSSAFLDNLRQLFAECDTDNNGCLSRSEFALLCSKIGLNKEATEDTFNRLDIDKNDRITFDEFAAGFNQYSKHNSTLNQPNLPLNPNQSAPESANQHVQQQPIRSESPASKVNKLASGSQKLSPVASVRAGRKSASPVGVISLGSTGSSNNNLTGGRSSSSNGGFAASCSADASELNSSVDNASSYNHQNQNLDKKESVVVYSSDMIGNNSCELASSSGQFNSLLSSSGSFSQLRTMQDLLESVQKLQSENQILTQIFFKDKREREEYISQLGEEFDQQVREVEERAKKLAREELEGEKKRLRDMMQAERETLQQHYQTIEKMSKLIKSPTGRIENGENIDQVKSKLEDTYLENRQLKKSLLDTKSDVAMIWKEMEKLKRQYEDKLSSAYERNIETRSECDHIKQQLSLMKDSNRKLQDASDVITNYITDKVEPVIKAGELDGSNYLSVNSGSASLGNRVASQSSSRKGSILSEYLNCDVDQEPQDDLAVDVGQQRERFNTSDSYNLDSASRPVHLRNKGADFKLSSSSSGSSFRSNSRKSSDWPQTEHNNNNTKVAQENPDEMRKSKSAHQQLSDNQDHERFLDDRLESSNSLSISDERLGSGSALGSASGQKVSHKSKQKHLSQLDISGKSGKSPSSLMNIGRHFFIGSRAQSDAQVNDGKTESRLVKSASADYLSEPVVGDADGPSRATFNIILVGDSFVGKSSFAARFIEGVFVQGLISNCSIDFKTRSYKVDGINYTVNLWDTA